jgi:hypothetical protein
VLAPGAPPFNRLQINHLQVLLQTHSTIACYECISKLARPQLLSVSLISFNLGLQLHVQTRMITGSKRTSQLAQSRPPCPSLSSLNLGLQLHLPPHSITAPKCISEFTQPRPPSPSPNPLDHSIPVHLHQQNVIRSGSLTQTSQTLR